MSLETWKAEFYPLEAKDCPAEQAIAHSLRKWEGLTEENTTKHGVCLSITTKRLYEAGQGNKALHIDSDSCALCVHHYRGREDYGKACVTCPLYAQNDDTRCDNSTLQKVNLFMDGLRNPLIMITALKETLKANE